VDDRYDPGVPAELERIKPSLGGGAFPHPPVLPVVAVLTLFVGLSIGFGLAARDGAAPTQPAIAPTLPVTQPSTAAPTAPEVFATDIICWGDGGACGGFIVVTPPPVVTVTAPPGGVTVTEAIAAAEKTYGISDSDIVDVRLVDNSDYYNDPSRADLWVWEIVVRGPGEVACAGSSRIVLPDGSGSYVTYDEVVVDYLTGSVRVMSTAVYP
jgi:hypothetical protein